jgi:cell division protein FtsB
MNKTIGYYIIGIFLITEISMYLSYYVFGKNGLSTLFRLKNEKHLLQEKMREIELHNIQLSKDIQDWKSDPFYAEKVAREQLQMALPDDIIGYLPNKGA